MRKEQEFNSTKLVKNPLLPSEIQNDVSHFLSSTDGEQADLLIIKTGNQWLQDASTQPIPRMLFDAFWHESEVCILFAESSLGKSILGVQIGESIANGKAIEGIRLEAQPQPVLYLDFELSEKQFENRYSIDYQQPYQFSNNFLRAQLNTDAEQPDGVNFEDHLLQQIEMAVISQKIKVVIIDNITYLRQDTERAKDALPLMKQLKKLKNKHGLSLLIIAHTPKRDASRPLTMNDLQGSRMLSNFADSIFCVGKSSTNVNTRYIKQIKERFGEKLYHSDNIYLCSIVKPLNFLKFEFTGFGSEFEHLMQTKTANPKAVEAMDLKQQGKTNVEIAEMYGVSESAVRKWLKSLPETSTDIDSDTPF